MYVHYSPFPSLHHSQGLVSPLEGLTRTLESGTGQHQYFVKLVPTVWTDDKGQEVHAYQYSVTEHLRPIDARSVVPDGSGNVVMPGLYFHYELSPLRVRMEKRRPSVGHFMTRVCAIVGGVFAVMGLLDAVIYRGVERWYSRGASGSGGMLGGVAGSGGGGGGTHLKM